MKASSKNRVTKRGCALVSVVFFWSALLLIGRSLYSGIKSQDIVGFPNSGQLKLYILFPAIMVIWNILLLAFSKKLPRVVMVSVVMVQIIPALVVFLLFGGGL